MSLDVYGQKGQKIENVKMTLKRQKDGQIR